LEIKNTLRQGRKLSLLSGGKTARELSAVHSKEMSVNLN